MIFHYPEHCIRTAVAALNPETERPLIAELRAALARHDGAPTVRLDLPAGDIAVMRGAYERAVLGERPRSPDTTDRGTGYYR